MFDMHVSPYDYIWIWEEGVCEEIRELCSLYIPVPCTTWTRVETGEGGGFRPPPLVDHVNVLCFDLVSILQAAYEGDRKWNQFYVSCHIHCTLSPHDVIPTVIEQSQS